MASDAADLELACHEIFDLGSLEHHFWWIAARVQPVEIPVWLSKTNNAELGPIANVFGKVVELLLAPRIKRGRVTQQQTIYADILGGFRQANDVLYRVEASVEEEIMLSFRLIDRNFHELDILGIGGGGLRYQQRPPEAEVDVAPHVVANARFIETFQIRAVARDNHVAEPVPILSRPILGFAFAVLCRHRLRLHQ